jgi:hypothetical protein
MTEAERIAAGLTRRSLAALRLAEQSLTLTVKFEADHTDPNCHNPGLVLAKRALQAVRLVLAHAKEIDDE